MVCSVVVAFAETTLKIASIFGFGRGFGINLGVSGWRRITEHDYGIDMRCRDEDGKRMKKVRRQIEEPGESWFAGMILDPFD